MNPLERTLSRREKQIAGPPPFLRGLLPAETVLGESPVSGRRMVSNDDFPNGILPLGRSVKQWGLQDCLPRFRIRACSTLVKREREEFTKFLGETERYFYE